VALDGSYAVCNRVESDRPSNDAGGGWLHWLRDRETFARATTPRPAPAALDAPRASPERCDRVYRRLLALLQLSQAHRQDLLARGFTDAEINARGYRSLPLQGRAAICREIAATCPLEGVPGFYQKKGAHGHYWTVAGSPGLLIKVLGPDGQIRGLRLRPDDKGDGGKYRWFSSNDRPGGAGSGAHCHVARPLGPVRDPTVFSTEGEIKADLAAERLGAVVLSVPGVDLWQRALDDLAVLLPEGGRAVTALDADWRNKPPVHRAVWSLLLACGAIGYDAEVALWDVKDGKGIDDLLVAGKRPGLHPPTAIPAPDWDLKVSSRVMRRTAVMPTGWPRPIKLVEARRRATATVRRTRPLTACA
jgi:hypothetical protein